MALLPRFDQPPGSTRASSLISLVRRCSIEELEVGEGLFFDGCWTPHPYVSVKCERNNWQTARFRTLSEAERCAAVLSDFNLRRSPVGT